MGNDWLTDELMQRAAKLIQDIDGIASQGSIYVVSRALYEERKRGREEERERACKILIGIADEIAKQALNKIEAQLGKSIASCAAAIRSGQ